MPFLVILFTDIRTHPLLCLPVRLLVGLLAWQLACNLGIYSPACVGDIFWLPSRL